MFQNACPAYATTACIILARGGSKGVPGKNLRSIGGVSLVGRAIRAARAAEKVSVVYVSTDDAAIALEATLHGARIIVCPPACTTPIVRREICVALPVARSIRRARTA